MSTSKSNFDNLVESSGIITHHKSLDILRQDGWSALVSPYYHDSISDTVRETDLIAEKQVNLSDQLWQSSRSINIQLFIECKYIKQEVLFWFDKIDKKKAVESLEQEAGISILYGKNSGDILPEKLSQLQNDLVAKLFSTNTNREDVIYKAMNQCLHSQIHYRLNKRPVFHDFNHHKDSKSKIIQRPVIVCDNFNKLLKIDFDGSGGYSTTEIKDKFVLEANYRDDYFLIDIVDTNHFSSFLSTVEQDVQLVMEAFSYQE